MREWGLILGFGAALVFCGCGGESAKPTKVSIPLPTKKSESSGPAPAAPQTAAPGMVKAETNPPPPYNYNPANKRDPFKPLVEDRTEGAAPAAVKKIPEVVSSGATPLERLSLEQVRLVAVIWNIRDTQGKMREPKALIEDGQGKGYIITQGTAIGKQQGKVSQITANEVTITEKYYDPSSGRIKTRDVPLKLHAD
jgi:Tfp pilus assembly protein PilP